MENSLLYPINEDLPILYCMICRIFSQKQKLVEKEKVENTRCHCCGGSATIKIHVDNPHMLIDLDYNTPAQGKKKQTRRHEYCSVINIYKVL